MSGPFLYDDDPAPLHTGTPRRRGGLLLAIFGGTVVAAVLMVFALPLINGTAEEQARESAGVFVAALEKGDIETAHGLLCEGERGHLGPDDVAAAYLVGDGGQVVGAEEADVDGTSVQKVRVSWNDGSGSTLTVVREDGPRVCGIN
ncbi:MAG: hypothetical protein JWQ99_2164 [Blastococcus sp.]|jgi:hypothetical protein|nr:hypothetical protein [Blastococcus sp.]